MRQELDGTGDSNDRDIAFPHITAFATTLGVANDVDDERT